MDGSLVIGCGIFGSFVVVDCGCNLVVGSGMLGSRAVGSDVVDVFDVMTG